MCAHTHTCVHADTCMDTLPHLGPYFLLMNHVLYILSAEVLKILQISLVNRMEIKLTHSL
jgi:hypothetical protein